MSVLRSLVFALLICTLSFVDAQVPVTTARWCVVNAMELAKCEALVEAMRVHTVTGRNTTVITGNVETIYHYTDLPQLECVQAGDQYKCMQMIFNGDADLIQLETGLSYTAGEYYNMAPLVAEKYQPGDNNLGLSYYAVAVARKDNPSVVFNTLKGKKVCFPGVGRAAGWIHPISTLMENGTMEIVECNVPVKSAEAFFGSMCAPDALARYYNPFGNNPTTVCTSCIGKLEAYCTCNDPYAEFHGAFKCMATGVGDVTFVRNSTVNEFVANGNTTMTADEFELVCLDGTRAPVTSAETCNWGKISSHVVMTSLVRDVFVRDQYKTLLLMMSIDFGDNGASTDLFKMFESVPFGRQNLMFSDETVMFQDVSQHTYYTWAGAEIRRRLVVLNSCPVSQARWCVISSYEMMKCENMMMAFTAKNLKPDLNCVKGETVQDCMQKINIGDADLITLDAADIYTAGKDFDLVPIASEDYGGIRSNIYYAVAVARRRDTFLTLFNLKQRRSCHGGMMTAAGWVVAVDKLIETGQIRVTDCNANRAVSQYFSKSCVPGILTQYYDPYQTNPINLCEACGTHGPKRCLRNDEEQYYGASGAFRCVTERGGDIGFVRHTTVRENTDGRNQADWARNRRSDDYELLCNDGTRKSIDDWDSCYLAELPPNAVVTAGFKSQKERDTYWTLLNFAQQFYDADTNEDFPMFDSTIGHKDLLFQDATVRLVLIPTQNQTYTAYLGPVFVRSMQRMATVDCVTGSRAECVCLSAFSYCFVLFLTICKLFCNV